MKLMRSIGGVVFVSALACGGDEGSSATTGSSSGTGSVGDPSTSAATEAASSTGETPTTGPTPTATTDANTSAASTGDDGTTTDLTTGGTDGTDGPASSSSSGGVAGTQCEGSAFAVCEDFEDADDGTFPAGWGARGDEWGEGVIGVASDDARLGAKSLKVDGGNNGQHFMDYKGELGPLASHHFGRVFMKVAVPAPWPADGVLHADFIEGLGPGPKDSTHNVRWGVVENVEMKMQWI